MSKFKRKFKALVAKTYVAFLRVFPIKKNRIYFISNDGRRYSCNPRAFFEYLYKNHKNEFEFYYCLNKETRKSLPKDVKSARYKSLKDLYYLNTSKYIVNNMRFHYIFKKRKGQIYIQTWHGGCIPVKAVEKAAEDKLNPSYVVSAKNDGKYIDVFPVGSKTLEELYKKYFWCDGEILNIGTPRYDKLINITAEDVLKAKTNLNLPTDKKLLLVAPTFKNNKPLEYDILDNEKIVKFFKEKLGEDIVVAYRFHPNVAEQAKSLNLQGVIDLTQAQDVDEVVIASDYLISDFSSIIIDGMFCGKKVFCYTKSLKDYLENDRDLWIDFEKYPIKICEDENSLFKEFEKSKNYNVKEMIDTAIKNFGISEDGQACERLYNYIKTKNK